VRKHVKTALVERPGAEQKSREKTAIVFSRLKPVCLFLDCLSLKPDGIYQKFFLVSGLAKMRVSVISIDHAVGVIQVVSEIKADDRDEEPQEP